MPQKTLPESQARMEKASILTIGNISPKPIKILTVNYTKGLFVSEEAHTTTNISCYSNLDKYLDDSRKADLYSIADFICGHR